MRVIAPAEQAGAVRDLLLAEPGATHVTVLPGVAVQPPGDVIEAAVTRESADALLDAMCGLGVDTTGGVTLEAIDTTLSDAADAAEEAAPGDPSDAVIWDEVVARTGEESRFSISFQAFLTIACLLAAIGAITDSAVTVVGAMVLGPEFGPLAAMAVGLVLGRRDLIRRGAFAIGAGFPMAMVGDLGSFPRPVLAALAAAERLLTRRSGAGVVLADPEDLGGSERSVVARARLARNPFSLPRTLVVKHYLAEPDPDRPDPFHYEVASCQLFTALPTESRPSPVLIAYDTQTRLLVLEDLGRSSTLADKLFGPDPAAAQRNMLSWARALGRMQAATAGREGDFGALLRRLGERAWGGPGAEGAPAAPA